MSDMQRVTIEVTRSTWLALVRDAKERMSKPEAIAAGAVEDYVRNSIQLGRRFADARREVERRLGTG